MALPASSPAGLDLVPPEHLEPPPGDQQRYVVRDECALLLDGYLRRLARQEACGRRVLGTLARAFLAQKGQDALGFARLGDFARERLGLSARELQSLARAVLGAEVAPWQVAEAAAAEGFSARGGELADPMAVTPGPEATPPPEPIDLHETPADLDWTAVTEALPGDLERLGEGAGALNAFALDQRMRTLVRARQRIDWQMGRLLRTFFALRLHRLMGFPSAAAYARERLGLSPRKARALVALERKTWEAPALLAAYRGGQLSWLRALMLLPVLSEVNAPAWIGRAQAVHGAAAGGRGGVGGRAAGRGRGPGGGERAAPAGGGARRGRAANACARGVPAPRRADRLLRARLARRPAARGDRGLCQARRAALVRVRAPARARRDRVAAPAAAPRPGLRARRLAVRGAGLHIAPQPP